IGVVEMPPQNLQRHVPGAGFDGGPDLAGRADADGVAQGDVVAAEVVHLLHDPGRLLRRDLALEGAADRDRDEAAHLDAVALRRFDHGAEAFDAFLDAAIDVPAREAFAGSGKDADRLGPGRACRLVTLHVRRQHLVGYAGPALKL